MSPLQSPTTAARQKLIDAFKANDALFQGTIREILPPKLNSFNGRTWVTRELVLNVAEELGEVRLACVEFDDKRCGMLELLKPGVQVLVLASVDSTRSNDGRYFQNVRGRFMMALRGERGWADVPNPAPKDMPQMTEAQQTQYAAANAEPLPPATDEGDDLPF